MKRKTKPAEDNSIAESATDIENRIIGEYLANQRATGVTAVDMEHLETIRNGIRLALA